MRHLSDPRFFCKISGFKIIIDLCLRKEYGIQIRFVRVVLHGPIYKGLNSYSAMAYTA